VTVFESQSSWGLYSHRKAVIFLKVLDCWLCPLQYIVECLCISTQAAIVQKMPAVFDEAEQLKTKTNKLETKTWNRWWLLQITMEDADYCHQLTLMQSQIPRKSKWHCVEGCESQLSVVVWWFILPCTCTMHVAVCQWLRSSLLIYEISEQIQFNWHKHFEEHSLKQFHLVWLCGVHFNRKYILISVNVSMNNHMCGIYVRPFHHCMESPGLF